MIKKCLSARLGNFLEYTSRNKNKGCQRGIYPIYETGHPNLAKKIV